MAHRVLALARPALANNEEIGGGQYSELWHNWCVYAYHWPYPDSLLPLLLLSGVIYAAWRLRGKCPYIGCAIAAEALMFAANFVFAGVLERRVWLMMMPFLTVPLLVSSAREARA